MSGPALHLHSPLGEASARFAGGPCLAYLRVSTEDQARPDKTSIADQRRAVDTLAGRLGLALSAESIFSDEGRSGATAEGRPEFMRLVEYCQRNAQTLQRPGHVLVLNDSRWGRFVDPEDATYWRVTLKRAGWLVRFAEGDDVEDPLGRGVLRTIHSAQASAYREAIRANARRGSRGTAEQGFWQTREPLGYRRQAIDSKTGRTRVLETGERKSDMEKVKLVLGPADEVDLVRWMFEQYATGTVSLGSLARQLKKRFPGRKWSRPVVGQVLRNVTYTGSIVWGRRPHDQQEAKVRRVRDRSEWVIVPDAFPALIPRALFQRVQETLDRNKRELRSKEGGYSLSGLLRCATCGEPYIGAGGPVGPEGDRDRYRFYRCRGGERGICPGRLGTLQARHVEPLVLDCMSDEFAKPHTQKMLARWVDDLLRKRTSGGKSREKALRAQRRDAERSIERVVQAIARGTLTDVEAAPELTAQRQLLADVDRAIAEDKLTAAQVQNLEATRERWLTLVRDFGALARGMRPALLRQTLRTLGVSGSVHKTRRRLDLAIPGVPKDLADEFSALVVPAGRGSP